MSWASCLLELCKRYGKAAKFASTSVLGAILPGSPAFLSLVEQAFETVEETSEKHWEIKVDAQLVATTGDLERLGELLGVLQGDLHHVTAQVARLERLPDVANQLIETALLSDPRCQDGARRVEGLAIRFEQLERQQEQLLVGQEEMRPLLNRALGICDYVEELRDAGFSVEVFGELLRAFQRALRLLGQGKLIEAEQALEAVSASRPSSATATLALAAAQTVSRNFLQAEQTLTKARRLRPEDRQLIALQHCMTSISKRGETPLGNESGERARQAPREGDVFDGWHLERLIGHGGWGLVFQAKRGERTAALKVMHPQLAADPTFVERFKREIITLARLGKQPHLVEIDSFGYSPENACWYFVMEWVEGITLERHLAQKGAIDWGEARDLFARLAEGLLAAHSRGIVHRDIKPANIMLRPDGRPVLVDFGLALDTDHGLTRTGRSAGYTALFAAPEQIRKNQADTRSDVYSLAAVLYHTLTYNDPARREPHCFKARFVPEAARDILTRALDNDPTERPADAGAFLEAFKDVVRAMIVDASGHGDFTSLARAVQESKPGSEIVVRPGHYWGSVEIHHLVRITGEGPREGIVIEGGPGPCFLVRCDEASISGLSLRGRGEIGVQLERGQLLVEGCDITSAAEVSISATGAESRLRLRKCLLHDSKQQGLLLSSGATANVEECEVTRTGGPGIEVQQGASLVLEKSSIHGSSSSGLFVTSSQVMVDHCDIHDNALAGIMVKRGGNPAIRNSVIHDGKQGGLFFLEGGKGLVEGCEIHGNALAGVESKHDSQPVLRRCTIRHGKLSGFLFSEGGGGVVEDCDVFGNELSGVESKSEGNPVLHRCRIHDNKANGLYVYEKGRGTFEDCDLRGNHLQGVGIKDGGNPVLKRCKLRENGECGVLVTARGLGLFEYCELASNGLAGIEIKQESEPILRGCSIYGGKQGGVFSADRGKGCLEDCDIHDNWLAGVEIKEQADPLFRRCKIRDGWTSGVYVCSGGRGTLEECEIAGNHLQGVAVKQDGNPTLKSCRIHDGRECGVFLYEKGSAVLKDCDIFANGLANVEIKEGSRPRLTRCTIRDGKVCGLLIWVGSTAQVEDCAITGNAFAGVEIKQGAEPVIVRCLVARNGGSAFYIHEQGAASIEGCEMRDNRLGNWDIGHGCRVRRQNNVG